MKFSEQWLRTWVDPPVSGTTLAEQLTMAGLEVEGIAPAAPAFGGVVAGRIAMAAPHPEADHLWDCAVEAGGPRPLRIVTAAPVKEGMCVAVAPAGAVLPTGPVGTAAFKGVTSEGMFCPADLLGLSEEHERLLELPAATVPGSDIRALLQLDDSVIEIAVTPNRGDCLSIAGVAREVAAANRLIATPVPIAPLPAAVPDRLPVEVEAAQACPRYLGRVITGIDPAAPTPWWLRERLRRAGVRSICAVVDVTNYVMLELGQPLHAFDRDKLDGGIRVRMARHGERLTLLDGQTITLQDTTLVIADRQRAVAVAGIMGGLDTAVDGGTRAVFLESAFFSPDAIAGRPRRYGLQTDSAYRFERGVDPGLPRLAMERATALLAEIAGGRAGAITETVAAAHLPPRRAIVLERAYLRRTLGTEVAADAVTGYLSRLGMQVEDAGDGWRVTPPSHRFDVTIAADLVEEIARLYGYGHLPLARPRHAMAVRGGHGAQIGRRMRNLLADRGYQEIIGYSFIDPVLQTLLDPEAAAPRLQNPISTDMAVMRSSLWPGLIQALQRNISRQQDRLWLFEIAPRYHGDGGQETAVAGALRGRAYPEHWDAPRRDADFYDAKGDIECLLALCAPVGEFVFEQGRHPALHPGQSAVIRRRGATAPVGWLGTLHPALQRHLDLDGAATVLFELSLEVLGEQRRPAFTELSRFPAVRRDIAVVVDQAVPAQALLDSVRAVSGALLLDLQLFDAYQGEHLELSRKSIALGLTLQDFSRTLTDRDVDEVVTAVLRRLKMDFGATLRE